MFTNRYALAESCSLAEAPLITLAFAHVCTDTECTYMIGRCTYSCNVHYCHIIPGQFDLTRWKPDAS